MWKSSEKFKICNSFSLCWGDSVPWTLRLTSLVPWIRFKHCLWWLIVKTFWKKPKYVYNIFAQFPQMPVFCLKLILSTGFKNKSITIRISPIVLQQQQQIRKGLLNCGFSTCLCLYVAIRIKRNNIENHNNLKKIEVK